MTTIQKGDRIRLLHMPDDPDPIPAGSIGTVTRVTTGPLGQVSVDWDSGRSLSLVPGVDRFEVIEPAAEASEPDSPTPVTVSNAVYEGIEAVRDSGMFNMLDLPAVAGLARQMGFDDAADWLNNRSNHPAYAQGIFRGFEPDRSDRSDRSEE
jgi:hypothetical protein